jgi:tRNA-binding protein
MTEPADITDFEKLDIRVGQVMKVLPFPEARKPAFQLWVDFGTELGIRQSSAQLTGLYTPETLVGRQVLAVVNFPPRSIAGFRSEVLVLGLPDGNGNVVLLSPERPVPEGGRVY